MSLGGHVLGARRLRRLRDLTGLPLDRAFIRGRDAGGVVWTDDGCRHYAIDPATGAYDEVVDPMHWHTCDPRNRATLPETRAERLDRMGVAHADLLAAAGYDVVDVVPAETVERFA